MTPRVNDLVRYRPCAESSWSGCAIDGRAVSLHAETGLIERLQVIAVSGTAETGRPLPHRGEVIGIEHKTGTVIMLAPAPRDSNPLIHRSCPHYRLIPWTWIRLAAGPARDLSKTAEVLWEVVCRDAELHARCAHPHFEYAMTEGPGWRPNPPHGECWRPNPPYGEGWEQNVHCGRASCNRPDAHEEIYWMRRLAPAKSIATDFPWNNDTSRAAQPSGAVPDETAAVRTGQECLTALTAGADDLRAALVKFLPERITNSDDAASGWMLQSELTSDPNDAQSGSMQSELTDARGRIVALTSALRALVLRIRRHGGHAEPEEQDALWIAEQLLAAKDNTPHTEHTPSKNP